MDRDSEKALTIEDYSWHILNNLQKFDNNPELIRSSTVTLKEKLSDHPVLAKFIEKFETALDYFEDHKGFPSIQWFEVNYAKSGQFKRDDTEFTMQVYEDWMKRVHAEIIKVKCRDVVNDVRLSPDKLRELMRMSSEYCDVSDGVYKPDKAGLLGLYKRYSANYKGIGTGISVLDDVIGVLGFKSLSVFGAPSGQGKSTFAISVAYNAAITGHCVDYISFEVPFDHMWFNLCSIEAAVMSHFEKDPARKERLNKFVSSDMKESKLKEDDSELFEEVMASLLKRVKDAGGFINIADKSMIPATTYEEFKVQLERMATEREDGGKKFERKADLIVIDNVDNMQIFKSSERDESTRVNNYIIDLDSFCKTYFNNAGCAIMLLTQLNRVGIKKLASASPSNDGDDDGKGKANIDYTVFSKFNALYEKPTCCLVGHADAGMRGRSMMNIYAVKLRNRGVPEEPIAVIADYPHSRIGWKAGTELPKCSQNSHQEEYREEVQASGKEDLDLAYSISDLEDDEGLRG